MTAMERIPVTWTGVTGLPGVSIFYGAPATPGAVADVFNLFDSLKALLPSGLQLEIPNSGDLIEDSDGSLAGSWTSTAGGTVACTGAGVWAAGVGARLVWRTNGVRNRRRVRGSTFLAPVVSTVFEGNGTLQTAARATIQTAVTAAAAGGNLLVWSRPTSVGAADGVSHAVLNGSVPDRVTALRSRRY